MDRRSIGRAAFATILLLVALGLWTIPWREAGSRTEPSASGRGAVTDRDGAPGQSAGDAASQSADTSAKATGQAASPDHGPAVAPGSRVRLKKLSAIDRRAEGAPPPAPRQTDLEKLRRAVPGVEVRFDPVTGSPDHILATGRFLTPAAGPEVDAALLVKRFMNEHAGIFGHGGAALDASRVTRDDVTAHNGMRTLVWQQQVDGVPVYKTILKANLTRDGALITLGSHFLQDAAAATGLAAGARAALVAQPPVDEKQALSLAAANLGDTVAPERGGRGVASRRRGKETAVHRAEAFRYRGAAFLAADERGLGAADLGCDADEPEAERDVPRAGGCADRRGAGAHIADQ